MLPLTQIFWFLIGKYSVAKIRYFIKKRNENNKNKFFDEKQEKNLKKVNENMK